LFLSLLKEFQEGGVGYDTNFFTMFIADAPPAVCVTVIDAVLFLPNGYPNMAALNYCPTIATIIYQALLKKKRDAAGDASDDWRQLLERAIRFEYYALLDSFRCMCPLSASFGSNNQQSQTEFLALQSHCGYVDFMRGLCRHNLTGRTDPLVLLHVAEEQPLLMQQAMSVGTTGSANDAPVMCFATAPPNEQLQENQGPPVAMAQAMEVPSTAATTAATTAAAAATTRATEDEEEEAAAGGEHLFTPNSPVGTNNWLSLSDDNLVATVYGCISIFARCSTGIVPGSRQDHPALVSFLQDQPAAFYKVLFSSDPPSPLRERVLQLLVELYGIRQMYMGLLRTNAIFTVAHHFRSAFLSALSYEAAHIETLLLSVVTIAVKLEDCADLRRTVQELDKTLGSSRDNQGQFRLCLEAVHSRKKSELILDKITVVDIKDFALHSVAKLMRVRKKAQHHQEEAAVESEVRRILDKEPVKNWRSLFAALAVDSPTVTATVSK
jgi:hypothetical protein